MSDRTDLNNEEEVRQLFVHDLKMRSFGRQVDYILNQMMEKYNNPPEDGEISVSYYGYLFPETVTYLRNMGLRTNMTVIPESETPRNVIYLDPTVLLSEEEIIESLRQSKIASIERNMAENEDDDFEEDEDWDEDLNEETEYKPFWKRFTDWLKSLGNKVLMRDEEDLEESYDFEEDYWEGDEEFDEEFDEDDFEEDDPEECDYLDEDYL